MMSAENTQVGFSFCTKESVTQTRCSEIERSNLNDNRPFPHVTDKLLDI